ncbi:MAG: ribosome biogenesis GTP-binding protein YsxC [Acidobacteria bacterium]|nr:ribosome biogenesis GTP-binding protein YsxC [Acidobacteriota bacterium]
MTPRLPTTRLLTSIEATFITSAASAADFPDGGLPEVAMVGRSNVGKSSLINALVKQRVARASAAPGKTRLANVYQVTRGTGGAMYLVDLPGYGFAKGERRELDEVTRQYFGREGREGPSPAAPALRAALLIIDARHPGLENDLEAWRWLRSTVERFGIVGTKIDKLARGERIHAMRELESVFEDAVLPVSAVTGEGLDELWKLIDRLTRPA